MKKSLIGLSISMVLGSSTILAASPFSQEMDYGKKLEVKAKDKAFKHIDSNRANKHIQLVSLDASKINSNSQSLKFDFNNESFSLDQTNFKQTGNGTQIWKGRVNGASSFDELLNSGILVRNGEKITGNIRYNGELLAIRPLTTDGHVIYKVDESLMPQDHPADFANIKDQSDRQNKGKPPKGGTNPPDPGNEPDPGASETIRVMVHYTPAAASASGDINGLIDLAIAETQQGYDNSNVVINLQLAGKYQVNYTESGSFSTDLARYRNFDGVMDEIHATRDQVSADIGILLINNSSSCGLASSIGSTAETAFANAHWDCATGYYSFGHEIGHLQSARHDPRADSSTTPYAYGHGYRYTGDRNDWRTVMAYNCSGRFGGCPRINYWSNPYRTYNNQPMGTVSESHNARVLNETKATVASFR